MSDFSSGGANSVGARLAGQGDVHAVRRHDMMFHTEIARVSRNRHAINSFENLSTEILMLMTIPHAQVESLAASAADHRPLLDALRERSGSAATHAIPTTTLTSVAPAIQVHLRSAWTLMLKLYSGRGRPDVAQVAA